MYEIIKSKANNEELLTLKEGKTNKSDSALMMRCIDIMHRQISHIIILVLELIKQGISNKIESQVVK